MQFVSNGPDIPMKLLRSHEEGRVVFFCGAGISQPEGLPLFGGLVGQLQRDCGLDTDEILNDAIKDKQFDIAMSRIEQLAPKEVARIKMADRLTISSDKPALFTHFALLTLAQSKQRKLRLVTTNYDRLFELAKDRLHKDGRELDPLAFCAPFLPVPKADWHGLVYLHGRLSATDGTSTLDHLIATSGDFGRAYLTERWAARFVSELFRETTICFVGYSLQDPVMRYLVDAIAADRAIGEKRPEVFALVDYEKDLAGTKRKWEAKNVTPILYESKENHRLLHDTLHAWADSYRDGLTGKERIASNAAQSDPNTMEYKDVDQVRWALCDESGLPASQFAKADPVPSIQWLKVLSEPSELVEFAASCSKPNNSTSIPGFHLFHRPCRTKDAPPMKMVGNDRNHVPLDAPMRNLIPWLVQHLDKPELLRWVVDNDGILHPEFAAAIDRELCARNIPDPQTKIWRLILDQSLEWNPAGRSMAHSIPKRLEKEGLSPSLRRSLRNLLAPAVQWHPPLTIFSTGEIHKRIRELFRAEISIHDEASHWMLEEIQKTPIWASIQGMFLNDATALLRRCCDLLRELEEADDERDLSSIFRPSIRKHEQNRDSQKWLILVDLARDSWEATAATSPEEAADCAKNWFRIPYPLFKRLAFHTGAFGDVVPTETIMGWLASNSSRWLWNMDTQRELLLLLPSLWVRASPDQRSRLETMLCRGPERDWFTDNATDDERRRISDRLIYSRLRHLENDGPLLGDESRQRIDEILKHHPQWISSLDEKATFPFYWDGSGSIRDIPPERCPETLEELIPWLVQPHPSHTDWPERCRSHVEMTAKALASITEEDQQIASHWSDALYTWFGASDDERLLVWTAIIPTLGSKSSEFIEMISPTLARWLEFFEKSENVTDDSFLDVCRIILDACTTEKTYLYGGDLADEAINHPVGWVAKVLIARWHYRAGDDCGQIHAPFLEVFTRLCDLAFPAYRPGRLMLCGQFAWLLRQDPDWSRTNLLPLFDWTINTTEAPYAWSGFLLTPRASPEVVQTLKPHLMAASKSYESLGDNARQYAAFLTFVIVHSNMDQVDGELLQAYRELPPKAIPASIKELRRLQTSTGSPQNEFWKHRARLFCEKFLLAQLSHIDSDTSKQLAQLCIDSGEAFPEAFQLFRSKLETVKEPNGVLKALKEANLCSREARTSLDLMHKILLGALWFDVNLCQECLKQIRDSGTITEYDPSLQDLQELCRRLTATEA